MFDLPCGNLRVRKRRPLVMGVLNVTPDSFSDGGTDASVEASVSRAVALLDAGADVVDVGPESTRPGADFVAADVQIARAIPVIQRVRALRPEAVISLDTRLAGVAAAGLAVGADIINDVSALGDPEMASVVSSAGAGLVLMHMRGAPSDMQTNPTYGDVVAEVVGFLRSRVERAVASGVVADRIVIDPGIGFGKTTAHNVSLLRGLESFVRTGYSVLLGVSRKRFLGELAHAAGSPRDRLGGSLACVARAMEAEVHFVRVHDVLETCHFIDTFSALGVTAR